MYTLQPIQAFSGLYEYGHKLLIVNNIPTHCITWMIQDKAILY